MKKIVWFNVKFPKSMIQKIDSLKYYESEARWVVVSRLVDSFFGREASGLTNSKNSIQQAITISSNSMSTKLSTALPLARQSKKVKTNIPEAKK